MKRGFNNTLSSQKKKEFSYLVPSVEISSTLSMKKYLNVQIFSFHNFNYWT